MNYSVLYYYIGFPWLDPWRRRGSTDPSPLCRTILYRYVIIVLRIRIRISWLNPIIYIFFFNKGPKHLQSTSLFQKKK